MAAGLALKLSDLPTFSRMFDQAVREQLGDQDLIPASSSTTIPWGLMR